MSGRRGGYAQSALDQGLGSRCSGATALALDRDCCWIVSLKGGATEYEAFALFCAPSRPTNVNNQICGSCITQELSGWCITLLNVFSKKKS